MNFHIQIGENMKSKTELADFLAIVCNFYNSHRETLNLSHDEAKQKIMDMYNDFYNWLYEGDEQC